MKASKREIDAVKTGRVVCLWRTRKPKWKPDRVYWLAEQLGPEATSEERQKARAEALQVTVLEINRPSLHEVPVADAKRSGFKDFVELGQWWRFQMPNGGSGQMYELRVLQGDHTQHPRLLKPGGGYTSSPHLAMKDEPEALSASDLALYASMSKEELDLRLERFRRESVAEAQRLLNGHLTKDARRRLRNLERVLNGLHP